MEEIMRWVILPEGESSDVQSKYAEILAVHAALLHTGEIIYFTGSQYLAQENLNKQFNHTRLFHCNTEEISTVDVPASMTDLFCCGHAMLPDGRLLVAGGTAIYGIPKGHFDADWPGKDDVPGIREAWIFDPIQRRWVEAPKMNSCPTHTHLALKRATKLATGGRWYPTLVTLPNGNVLAMAGRPGADDARRTNTRP